MPFYNIFDALRKKGFELGIDEYKALLDILTGYNLFDSTGGTIARDDLMTICKLLWLKPNQAPYVFETIFNEAYDAAGLRDEQSAAKADNGGTQPTPDPAASKATEPERPEAPKDKQPETADQPARKDAMPELRYFRIDTGGSQGAATDLKNTPSGPVRKFLFGSNPFPISPRDLYQVLSQLPIRRHTTAHHDIDIAATISSIAANGFLKEIKFSRREEIVNHIALLHDHMGSMVAFEQLSEYISKTAIKAFGGTTAAAHTSSRYFSNVVTDQLYPDKTLMSTVPTNAFIQQISNKKACIIIISDAGAARGSNSDARVRATIRMIRKLQQATTNIIWLNPLPRNRWAFTSAERIARFVPMYTIDRPGIQQAIDLLRGRKLKTITT